MAKGKAPDSGVSTATPKKPQHFNAKVDVVDSGENGILVHVRAEDSEGNSLIFDTDSAMVNRGGDLLLIKATRRTNECPATV